MSNLDAGEQHGCLEGFDGLLQLPLLLEYARVDEVVDRVLAHLKVETEPHLEGLAGSLEVIRVQVHLMHSVFSILQLLGFCGIIPLAWLVSR